MALLYRMGTGNRSGGDLKPFIINFTCHSGFIGKTVTMEFQGTPHAGETVDNVSGTVASDGTLTLYPMHDGLWKYYATSDLSGYHEKTITLEKWGNYPVELLDAPNGATVTPTDDVQTWLHCANIWDKTDLTTIDDVIRDTTTLNTLISDNNASDYLARSTTWASDVCSNESAMTYIGLNDYCANKLLTNSTWIEAICNSTYFEKVLNALVLPMTSNTEPSGYEASSSSNYDTTTLPYKAFDSITDASSEWAASMNSQNNSYLQIKIKNAKVIKLIKIDLDYRVSSSYYRTGIFDLLASNTGDFNGEEVNLTPNHLTIEKTNSKYSINEMINNNAAYQYYRIKTIQYNCTYAGQKYAVLNNVQLYGREA